MGSKHDDIGHMIFSRHAVERFRERTGGAFDEASFSACCTVMRGMVYNDGLKLGGQKGNSLAIQALCKTTGEDLVLILEPVMHVKTVLTKDQYIVNTQA